MPSPTQRTLKFLADQGYLCAVVERWNPYARIRQDLFGILDIVGVKKGSTVGVQTTTASNMSARVKKLQQHPSLKRLKGAGWSVVVHGWVKRDGHWICKERKL